MGQKTGKKGDRPSNVLYLSRYRRSSHKAVSHLYYLNQEGACEPVLTSDPGLKVFDIRSQDDLKAQQGSFAPDIILIESEIRWADPMTLIAELESKHQVPIVFVCSGKNDTSANRKTVKAAYAAGACDTLFTPLEPEELFAALDVLIKFQQRQTIYH